MLAHRTNHLVQRQVWLFLDQSQQELRMLLQWRVWTSPVPAAVKGIIHVPIHNTPMKPSRREALLIAIAKARNWIDDLAHGRAASFAAIARREGMVERHVRLLAPLAFVSPRIVSALLDGTAPADLTRTTLARALPDSWAEQERRLAPIRRGVQEGST